MGDLEKNDKIFRKKSRHVFCKQIYQIHHCKYENDHPHHCKYLPIFISFTIDNVVDNIEDLHQKNDIRNIIETFHISIICTKKMTFFIFDFIDFLDR